MAITMKTLITLFFTIFLIVSSVHCGITATADTLGYGEIKQEVCYDFSRPCDFGGERGCDQFCLDWGWISGHCIPRKCCCNK
ncbi:hypothetical protein N665_0334s0024 [Sinapis alba]|nr:hypothetical protein N665_2581s0001 [Sinapis alba]KAF8048278.1 hypothetical protein N665_2581s0002 [Sinapis alba]KAF8095402.1 hypothetical protein N665_0334s0022 [Sinapis alba]KAF8095404.1 hypothetical protein N665_0334s0024 [Sinapis alba]